MALIKCPKCGKEISDKNVIVWKCNSCGKAFKVTKVQLQNLVNKKALNPDQYLLKCPTCKNGMDDGNESIAWRCSCGKMSMVRLKEFGENEDNLPRSNNLIKCPKCGMEISSKAKRCVHCGEVFAENRLKTRICIDCGREVPYDDVECPFCGCPIETSKEQQTIVFMDKRSKEKRKVLNERLLFVSIALIALILFVTIFFIRSENKKQSDLLIDASAFNDEIAELKKQGLPTTYELQDMMVRYNLFNDEQKAQITNYSDILAFSQLNIDGINKVQKQIDDQLKSETKKYKNVIEIKADYDKLSIEEQKYIHDIDELLKYIELSNADKAALVGVKNIRSVLKNQESLQIEKINVKDNTANGGSYYVVISYSAQNGFGGNKSSTSCFAISREFVDPFWTLALLSDINKYLNENLNLYSLYLECEEEDQHIDVDKIMANLDTEIVVE